MSDLPCYTFGMRCGHGMLKTLD